MPKKKPKALLVESLRGRCPPRRGPQTWYERLARERPQEWEQLVELRRAWLAGKLKGHWTARSLTMLPEVTEMDLGVQPRTLEPWFLGDK